MRDRVKDDWVQADFNGLFGDVLCLSHEETVTDLAGRVINLRGGIVVTAFDWDSDEHDCPDNLLATGVVEPSPDSLQHRGSRWVLRIDGNGVRHQSDLDEPDRVWVRRTRHAIGGFCAAGFVGGSENLLVVSFQGRGLFDCFAAVRVARERSSQDYDPVTQTAGAIGRFAGQRIPIHGIGGAIRTRFALPTETKDGWTLAIRDRGSPSDGVDVLLAAPGGGEAQGLAVVEDVRAFGFSPSGRTLVVGEPHTLHLWSR